MGTPELGSLRKLLAELPKRAAETALLGWDLGPSGTILTGQTFKGIRYAAELYAVRIAPAPGDTPYREMAKLSSETIQGKASCPGRKKSTACDVEKELRVLADGARRFREDLKSISPEGLNWLAQAASVEESPFWQEWFFIPSGWMRRSEIDFEVHEIMARQLETLALELDAQAFLAGLKKQDARGPRRASAEKLAKDELMASLEEVVAEIGRASTHAGDIGKVVSEWATTKPVDGKWGIKARARARRLLTPRKNNSSE